MSGRGGGFMTEGKSILSKKDKEVILEALENYAGDLLTFADLVDVDDDGVATEYAEKVELVLFRFRDYMGRL